MGKWMRMKNEDGDEFGVEIGMEMGMDGVGDGDGNGDGDGDGDEDGDGLGLNTGLVVEMGIGGEWGCTGLELAMGQRRWLLALGGAQLCSSPSAPPTRPKAAPFLAG